MIRVTIWILLANLFLALGYPPVQKKKPAKINDDFIAVSISQSLRTVVLCASACRFEGCTGNRVTLTANSTNPKHEQLTFEWTVDAGKLSGEGTSVEWDLFGVVTGQYNATVLVKGKGREGGAQVMVTIVEGACEAPPPKCPQISVSCRESNGDASMLTCSAYVDLRQAEPYTTPYFKWIVTKGRIVRGQNAKDLEIDLKGVENETVTATVDVAGFDPACMSTASYTSNIHR